MDASTLVLYNAVQPPLTALLALLVDPARTYSAYEAGGTLLVMAALGASTPTADRLLRRLLLHAGHQINLGRAASAHASAEEVEARRRA